MTLHDTIHNVSCPFKSMEEIRLANKENSDSCGKSWSYAKTANTTYCSDVVY